MIKKILCLLFVANVLFAQQGPSIRLVGDLPSNAIPVSVGDRAIAASGIIYSNGTVIITNLIVLGTASLPGPFVVDSISSTNINVGSTGAIWAGGKNIVTNKADIDGSNTMFNVTRYLATAGGTNYVAMQMWDATNKAFRVIEFIP